MMSWPHLLSQKETTLLSHIRGLYVSVLGNCDRSAYADMWWKLRLSTLSHVMHTILCTLYIPYTTYNVSSYSYEDEANWLYISTRLIIWFRASAEYSGTKMVRPKHSAQFLTAWRSCSPRSCFSFSRQISRFLSRYIDKSAVSIQISRFLSRYVNNRGRSSTRVLDYSTQFC